MLFTPRQLTQEAPLQQFAISIANYNGPGTYPLDATTLRFSLRSRVLHVIEPGSVLTVAADGSGSIRATGRFDESSDVRLDATFTCVDGGR